MDSSRFRPVPIGVLDTPQPSDAPGTDMLARQSWLDMIAGAAVPPQPPVGGYGGNPDVGPMFRWPMPKSRADESTLTPQANFDSPFLAMMSQLLQRQPLGEPPNPFLQPPMVANQMLAPLFMMAPSTQTAPMIGQGQTPTLGAGAARTPVDPIANFQADRTPVRP